MGDIRRNICLILTEFFVELTLKKNAIENETLLIMKTLLKKKIHSKVKRFWVKTKSSIKTTPKKNAIETFQFRLKRFWRFSVPFYSSKKRFWKVSVSFYLVKNAFDKCQLRFIWEKTLSKSFSSVFRFRFYKNAFGN